MCRRSAISCPRCVDPRHRALVVRRVRNHARNAVGVRLTRGQPKEQLGARVAKGRGEHSSDLLRFSPPLADVIDERAHAPQPFVTEAVESPVHRSLSPAPQRPEGTRDHEHGEGRHPGRTSTEDDAREQRDGGVEETERCGDEGVDERPVDQSIDFVQPVARYSDADRDRHCRLHPEEEADHGVAGLAEHEAPDKKTHDSQWDQKRGVGQPEHLQPLDPLGALVATPDRRRADEEAHEHRQPGRQPQKAEAVRQPKGNRVRHVRERLLELLRQHQQQQQEGHRADGEDRVRAPPRRRKSAVGEHERNCQRPGEEGRP